MIASVFFTSWIFHVFLMWWEKKILYVGYNAANGCPSFLCNKWRTRLFAFISMISLQIKFLLDWQCEMVSEELNSCKNGHNATIIW